MIFAFRQETGLKLSKAKELDDTVFASMTNGDCALVGKMEKRRELSSVTTINDYISTPGEILLEEFLEPMGVSQYRLAKAVGKNQSTISDIVHGRRAITAEMAWLLSQALGTSAQFWLNLQTTYDLKTLNTSQLPKVEPLAV